MVNWDSAFLQVKYMRDCHAATLRVENLLNSHSLYGLRLYYGNVFFSEILRKTSISGQNNSETRMTLDDITHTMVCLIPSFSHSGWNWELQMPDQSQPEAFTATSRLVQGGDYEIFYGAGYLIATDYGMVAIPEFVCVKEDSIGVDLVKLKRLLGDARFPGVARPVPPYERVGFMLIAPARLLPLTEGSFMYLEKPYIDPRWPST